VTTFFPDESLLQGEGDPKERRPAAATARLPNTGLPGKEIRPSPGNTHEGKRQKEFPVLGTVDLAG